MGCDIHCFIEYSTFEKQDGTAYWIPFGGEIHGSRNYEMFALLAGVRGGGSPLFEPRGMPENPSYGVRSEYHLWIEDEKEGGERTCARADAERWIKEGISRPVLDHRGEIKWVTHPDAHTVSWLAAPEFLQVLRRYAETHNNDMGAVPPDYYAMLAAMDSFVARGAQTRLVFWFDN